MKDINLYITEKFKISASKDKKYFTDIVPGINFEEPTEEDCKKLEDALRKNGLLNFPNKLDNRYHTYHNWFIGISRGGIALKANTTYSKPYKKKKNYDLTFIEFSNDGDSFIAGNSGGVFYEYESPEAWEKVILPIANFFGAKFTKDGEFVMPGTKSKWND